LKLTNTGGLVVDKISVTYSHSIAALHGVSISLRKGEILALLGANGSGKTTTLRAVSNLLAPDRGQVIDGSIKFGGLDVLATRPAELVRAGLVPVLEGRHVFKSLTVEENLITGGIGRDSSRSEIAHDLEQVYSFFPRLKIKRAEHAGLTSGGEQQMLAIGRALMSRPCLLVLDEPSMGLAPLIVQGIFDVLSSLNRQFGLTILMAEQNAAIALKHAHKAVVIENGVDVLQGPAAELRRRADIKSFYLGEGLAKEKLRNMGAAGAVA
jgi:branched-chain amino acid transport system ATP-binding protein